MRALKLAALVAGVLIPKMALCASTEEEAGDVAEVDKDAASPLRERVRPVSGYLFLKKGRFELSPGVTLSVKDAFWTKYLLGGSATLHVTETVGIGLRFGYSLPVISRAAQICTTEENGGNRGCAPPTPSASNGKGPGQIRMAGGLDLQWSPIYGKISLSSESFLHFDMYGMLGAQGINYAGPGPTTATCTSAEGCSETAWTVGGNVGLGMRIFLNRWLTFRTELRDVLYSEKVYEGGDQFRGQLAVDFGLSIFFPTEFQEG